MICKNCEEHFDGKFCNNCGQNSKVRKVDFKYIAQEIPDGVFQLNRGFFYTMKQLTLQPGNSIKEFLGGKRKPYYKPLAFFLVTSTVYLLLCYLLDRNTFIDDFLSGWKAGMENNAQSSSLNWINWISKNQTYFILLFLPVFSVASYLAFIKSKYNYFEHLVINLYITGYQMMIYLILGFIFFKENLLLLVPLFIGFVYNIWTFSQVFNKKKISTKIGLISLTYLIFMIIIFALMFVAALIIKMVK